MSKIYLQTLAYNAEKTIRRCVNSILNQTYSGEVEWHILDNGSTDHTLQILTEYAQIYPFIHISHIDKNLAPQNAKEKMLLEQVTLRTNLDLSDDDFYCMLDSDDEYKADFFEKMMRFIQKHHLDIAVAGNDFVDESTGFLRGVRKLEQHLILNDPDAFEKYFPVYHGHMRPVWGKLFRGATIRNYTRNEKLTYGNDTCFVFYALSQSSRVGILNESLYKYYISPHSTSYRYTSSRFSSDVYLYNNAINFLASFGPISARNRDFLQAVYSNAVTDTAGVIRKSGLSPAEKLREYRRIAENPITRAAYRECTDEDAERSKALLLQSVLEAGAALDGRDNEDFRAVIQQFLPCCGRAVTAENLALFLRTPELLKALLRDDPDIILRDLLSRVEQGRDVKKYALAEMIQALAADRPLLCQINDTAFLKKYGDIYWRVWQEDFLAALDEMTGLLLENQVRGGRERFLKLYISLSAQLEQAGAFAFGKLRLAELYFSQNRMAECRSLVEELKEMGLGEEDEVRVLRSKLENGIFQT